MAIARFIACTALAATSVLARTDISGCTSTDVSSPAGASVAWYVPGTGELCEFLDCGGGLAPPRHDVAGCPQYTGTASYSPSYLPGYGAATATASTAPTSSGSFDWSSAVSAASTATQIYSTAGGGATDSAAWSSLTSAAGSATGAYSSAPGVTTGASSMSSVTLVGTGYGGSNATGTGGNATISTSGNPSAPVSTGGAADSKVWVGSAGLVAALGVVIAAL